MSQLSDYKTFPLPRVGEDLGQYQLIPYHMCFDVKFDGRRKSRLVAQGNKAVIQLKTCTPELSVLSRFV
jgi:hypothetical protein